MNIELTADELSYLQNILRRDIQGFYDDPDGCLGAEVVDPAIVTAEVNRLAVLCGKLGLDFNTVVREEATDYEIERVEKLKLDRGRQRKG